MKKKIEWVFLLLETPEEEMIFVQENNEKNKSWKNQWQYFFPAWTIEKWESIEQTIHREFEEETWLNWMATIVGKTVEKLGILLLETDDATLIAHVYKGSIPSDTKIKTEKFNSEEILWIVMDHPKSIISTEVNKIRPWLLEALLLKEGITYQETITIKDWVYSDQMLAQEKIKRLQELYLQKKWYS